MRELAPRLLDAEEAAAYLGRVSTKTLAHVPVAPVRLGDRCLYDRRAIDAWLDRLSGLEEAQLHDDPQAELLARRSRKAQGKA